MCVCADEVALYLLRAYSNQRYKYKSNEKAKVNTEKGVKHRETKMKFLKLHLC